MNPVDTIVSQTTEKATTIAFRHIGYLFQYNENIRNLEDETKGIEDILRRINDMVARSRRNAEDIYPDVGNWQKAAEEMQIEVTAFLENKVRSNTRCVNCSCANLMWRYRLGKESKLKTSRVISLKERGEKYFTGVPLSHPAPPPEHPLTSHEAFDSRQEIFNGIMEALKDPTIKMIGVHGAGGVGKTTMVKEVGNLAKRIGLFDDVAIAVVSRTLNKKNVQGELAAELGLNLDDHGRENKLWTRLQNGKKNLVILDDVWDPLNLEDIGIPTTTDNGNKEGCCKVLVTSRKQLLHMMTPKPADQRAPGVSVREPVASTKAFYILILKNKEAWTLFMKTVEIPVNSNEEMLSVAKKICDECGGLPVAILAVASSLKGKESYAWKDALEQLKNSDFNQIVDIDQNLFSSLKLSYDYLEPRDARSCFLLCSLFPEDAEISIEDLVRYSIGMRLLGPILSTSGVRNRVLTLVKGLKASCLLLEGRDDNTVKMHDVIRDVAILIAKGEKGYLVKHDLKKWPEEGTYEGYSAISFKSEHFCEIPSELGCKELHTMVLRSRDSSLPDSFFEGMETNLEVLDLSSMAIESLPSSLSKLVKLRMLFLPDQVTDLSLLGELKSLEILYVKGISELAPEIRELTCLKLLDLGNMKKLTLIPPNVLSNLSRMEELCIPDYFNRWQDEATEERKNASLVELNSLTCLTTLKVHIPQDKSSPKHLCFENLIRFRISIGEQFTSNYQYDDIPSTNILKICDVPLEGKYKVLLVNPEVLYLHGVKGLEEVFHDRDGSVLFNLKYLEVKRCDGGEHLLGRPKKFLQTPQRSMSRSFCNLIELHVEDCRFKSLFYLSVVRCLEQLQQLCVRECPNMEVIVGNERQGDDEEITFTQLKKMKLTNLANLRSFCPSKRPNSISEASNSDHAQPLFCGKVVFPCLVSLWIEGLGINMKGIWNMTPPANSFQKLTKLQLHDCPDLLYVAPSELLRSLQNLRDIRIRSCKLLEEVFKNRGSDSEEVPRHEPTSQQVDTNVVLPHLKSVQLYNLPRLKSFFSGIKLPSSKERDGANNELFVFPKLEKILLWYMANLQGFYSSNGPEESLFNQKVVFPCLVSLLISGGLGTNVKGIWNKTPPAKSFQKLTSLNLEGCHDLLYVAPSELLGSLQNLSTLTIKSCNLLEEVFKSRGSDFREGIVPRHEPTSEQVDTNVALPHLKRVFLEDLQRLKSFCSEIKLPSSVKREIRSCPLLEITPFWRNTEAG